MKLNPSDTKKLIANLQKLGIRPAVAQAYLTGLQPGTGQPFKTAEREIALALIKKKPKQFGWAIRTTGPGAILVEANTGLILTSPNNQPVLRQNPVTIRPQPIVTVPFLATAILGNEGRVTHMYPDTDGFPTIGVGHLIENLGEAQNLPFVYKVSGNRASAADIATEFNQISTFGSHNYFASYFDALTTLEISSSDIDSLLDTDVRDHRDIADTFFPLWKLPQWGQVGLVDLAFQVGAGTPKTATMPASGLHPQSYPNLLKALQRRDLERAGKETNVKNDATRNAARLAFFQKDLAAAPFFTTDPQKKEKFVKRLLKP